ncbi:MAG: ATP synthase F0 subunit C [Myxococcaceae bacterium]
MKRLITLATVFSSTLFANEGAAAASNEANFAWYAIAAAAAIGLAALGGTLAQGRAAAAALEGIARNPSASGKIFVPMILGMALIESLVLFALLIAFMIFGKIA